MSLSPHNLAMIVALLAGLGLASRNGNGLPVAPRQRLAILLGALIGAVFGSKLPYLFGDWNRFLDGSAWFSDGKTILTGLVGGYFGVELAKWSVDVRVSTGDSFLVPVAVAVAIGRIGCFLAGCCYGTPTGLPWGVVFASVDSLPRHPTQLYEAAFHAAAAAGGCWMARRQWFVGNRIRLYILLYAVYRFGSEWIRPEARLYGGWTGFQIASLVIAALMAWLWWRNRGSGGAAGNPEKFLESG